MMITNSRCDLLIYLVGLLSLESVWMFRTIWQVTYLKQLKNEKPLLHHILIVWFLLLFAAYYIPVAVKLI
jgi:hypothetical protein